MYADTRKMVIATGQGIDPTGATPSTAALRGLVREAHGRGWVLFFPAGTYLVDGPLVDGDVGSYAWEGERPERGANAEAQSPGFSATVIKYRPADPSQPLVRAYSTQAPVAGVIGPFTHRNLHFDVGAAHGFVFGVEDHRNPGVVNPVAPVPPSDGADGQRYVFGVRFDGVSIRGANASRGSTRAGVITRAGTRLVSLTKCFETVFNSVSLNGGDTQVRAWGCDKPVFRDVRAQHGHLPFDFHGAGTFTVQHTMESVQIEGWTFTPVRSHNVNVAVTDSTWEQNDGGPYGGGRFRLPGAVAVTADTGTLQFTEDMGGVLHPGLSLLEITDGVNTTTALVTTVSGRAVTVDTTTTVITWTHPAATATRVHGYGPFHSGAYGASYTNCTPGASRDCPATVWQVGRGSMNHVGVVPVPGHYGDIRSLPLGNRHGDQNNIQGSMTFQGCAPMVTPDPGNPFVTVEGTRPTLGSWYGGDANTRAPYGDFTDAELVLRRRWVFTPATATASSHSNRTPIEPLPDEANTGQRTWAWNTRGKAVFLHDPSLPNNPAHTVRIRVRARSTGATGTLRLTYYGQGGGNGPRFTLTDRFAVYEAVVPVPHQWQGVRTSAGTVGFVVEGDPMHLAGVLVEEITAQDTGVFPGGVTTGTTRGKPVRAAPDGSILVDTAGALLWVRAAGAWKSAPLT